MYVPSSTEVIETGTRILVRPHASVCDDLPLSLICTRSLSWREQSDRCSHNHLCVGTSSGTIYIWNVCVATDSTSTR